ncbi:MAG: DinB family protein [Bacteroidetes bacterium]|jgi:uncharacterized damage-inducible protein DinB|nr:DinB family protein [Bacteroidota bacterium]
MKAAAKENLYQLQDLLQNLSEKEYTKSLEVLSGASIGQHIRHILEIYLLLVSGSFTGIICYDKRKRDPLIENETLHAILIVNKLLVEIDTLDVNRTVKFEADYNIGDDSQHPVISSVGRELSYCIEHSIHHQALIKVALIALELPNITSNNFGVAYSTIRYRNNQCAQ